MTFAQCVRLFNQVKKIIPDNGKLRISPDGAHAIPDNGMNQESGQNFQRLIVSSNSRLYSALGNI